MLVDGSTVVEAVRSGVRKYKYDWLSRYNTCYASRVYGGENKFENTNKTWAQVATDWACGKVGTPYKITADKIAISIVTVIMSLMTVTHFILNTFC